jgi:hypothetical protein
MSLSNSLRRGVVVFTVPFGHMMSFVARLCGENVYPLIVMGRSTFQLVSELRSTVREVFEELVPTLYDSLIRTDNSRAANQTCLDKVSRDLANGHDNIANDLPPFE